MTIGWAIFLSTVLVLAVFRQDFRKALLWFSGAAALLAGLWFGGLFLYHRHQENLQEDQAKKAEARKKLVKNASYGRKQGQRSRPDLS